MDTELAPLLDSTLSLLQQQTVWAPLWALGSVLAAWLVAIVVRRQLTAFGLSLGGRDQLSWPRLFGSTAGWIALLLLLRGLCDRLGLLGLSEGAGDLVALLVSLVPAGAILAGASTYARARRRAVEDRAPEARQEAEAELRWLPMAAGGLAALTLVEGLSGVLSSGVLVAAIAAVALVASPELRAKASAARDNLLAGPAIARKARVGERLTLSDGPVELMGPPGLLETWVKAEDGPARVSNAALLARLQAPPKSEGA